MLVCGEQQIDMAWEGRLTLPICTDANGAWSGDDEAFMHSFSRIRVEVKVGSGSYAALIDGPVVGYDSQGVNEQVVPGVNGLLVPTDGDFAASLAQVCEDADLRKRFGAAARIWNQWMAA